MTRFYDDPTLDELLGDPVTQAIMKADRVDRPKLEVMLRSMAREIAGASGRPATGLLPDEASCCVSGSRIRSQLCGAP